MNHHIAQFVLLCFAVYFFAIALAAGPSRHPAYAGMGRALLVFFGIVLIGFDIGWFIFDGITVP